MSATRQPQSRARRVKGTARTTRLRLVRCAAESGGCGYTVRMARSWMAVALPPCPNPQCAHHGQAMQCGELSDAVELGYISLDELPRPVRTALCHRMGWEDEIVRTSPSQAAGAQRVNIRKPATDLPF